MKNPLGNMANLMKQAQAMQAQMAKLQEEAATKTVTGTAGGGMVSVTANGGMEIVSVVINPEAAKSGDVDMAVSTSDLNRCEIIQIDIQQFVTHSPILSSQGSLVVSERIT